MIERKSGVLYEILIRGEFDNGAVLGQFKGGHLVEAEAIVDTKTGEILSYKHGAPVPISEARAKEYFGEQFASFNAGFDALRSQNANLMAGLAEANDKIASLSTDAESRTAALEAAISELSQVRGDLAKALETKTDPAVST